MYLDNLAIKICTTTVGVSVSFRATPPWRTSSFLVLGLRRMLLQLGPVVGGCGEVRQGLPLGVLGDNHGNQSKHT